MWSGVVSGKYNSEMIRQSSENCIHREENKNDRFIRSQTTVDPLIDKRKSCPSIVNGQDQQGRIKRCLSGFGRGKLTLPDKNEIKAKSNHAFDRKNHNQKPIFY